MAAKKKAAEASADLAQPAAVVNVAAPVETAPAPAPKKGAPIVVKYRDHAGKPAERTFPADVHGENFAALAEEFKATNASKLITE